MCLGLVGEAVTCTVMLAPFTPELSGPCQPSMCLIPQGEAADKLGELCLPKQRPPVATSPQPSGEAHVPMPSPFAAASSWMDASTLVGSPPQSSSYEQYKRALHQEWDDVRDEGASEASEEVRDGRDRPPLACPPHRATLILRDRFRSHLGLCGWPGGGAHGIPLAGHWIPPCI